MVQRISVLPLISLLLVCSPTVCSAGIIQFTNEADFLAATVNPSLESFESFSATNSRNLTNLAANDFTLSVGPGENFGVFNQAPDFFGTFATHGVNYVVSHVATSSMTFTFNQPVAAFGLNVTDFGDNQAGDLILSVGPDSYTIASGPRPNGNQLFFGVIDTMGSFSSVTLTAQGDSIGIDEVYTAETVQIVPEPHSLAMFLIGICCVTLLSVVRRSRRQTPAYS